MSRIKIFDVPHKGIRHGLSQLELQASETNFSNVEEVGQLHELGTEVFKILSNHHSHEDSIILVDLEKRMPGSSKRDIKEHETINLISDQLESKLNKIFKLRNSGQNVASLGEEFFLDLSEFHSDYLRHMAEEERKTQGQLWQCFSDEELMEMTKRIMGSIPPETLLIWAKYIFPALNENERVELSKNVKAIAPAPFFNSILETIKNVLAPKKFSQLQSTLG